jgi:hypothetical protein
MSIKKALLILPLSLALSGCVIVADGDWDDDDYTSSNWKAEQKQNRESISNLSLGQERSEIVSLMGAATFTEAFTGENGSGYQILFYRTQREHGDGDTTKDETTPLVFENDKLIGWGNDALQRIR